MTSILKGQFDNKLLASINDKAKVLDVRLFQRVSLFDMLEFDVFHFVRYSDTLLKLQNEIEAREDIPLNPREQQNCLAVMNDIQSFLAGFQIDVGRCFERIGIKIRHPEKALPKLSAMILELRNRINDEIKERLFMYIPTEEAKYYEQYALFGQDVALKFPEANKEITEAGNCYATGNYTACVFHLMRAVEYGARALVVRLRAPNKTHG